MRKALFTGKPEKLNKYANAQPKNRAVASKCTIKLKYKESKHLKGCSGPALVTLFRSLVLTIVGPQRLATSQVVDDQQNVDPVCFGGKPAWAHE